MMGTQACMGDMNACMNDVDWAKALLVRNYRAAVCCDTVMVTGFFGNNGGIVIGPLGANELPPGVPVAMAGNTTT